MGHARSRASDGRALTALLRDHREELIRSWTQRVLTDPNVPEAVKAQLRAQKGNMQASYGANKGWADWVMGLVTKANPTENLAVVQRHRSELQAAFAAK